MFEVFESLRNVLIDYLGLILLIFIGEIVLSYFLFKLFTKLLGLRSSLAGEIVALVITPIIHHLSLVVPLIGHLVTTVILSLMLGGIYSKGNSGDKAGCMTGFILLIVRLILHYVIVILGIVVFAGKLLSDLSSIL